MILMACMVAEEGQPDDNNGLLVISRRVRE